MVYAPYCLAYALAMRDGIEVVEVPYCGHTFRFYIGKQNVGHDIFHAAGLFQEIRELEYSRKLIPKRAVIVDVGANTGNNTVFMAGMLSPKLIIPIEPTPISAEILRANLGLNKMQVDERGIGVAAGKSADRLFLDLPENADLVLARTTDQPQSSGAISVPTVRLDDLVPERVDFLKIDVEGFENDVIAGARRIITDDKPLLMVELTEDRRAAFSEMLAGYGYIPLRGFRGVGYQNVFFRVQ